MDATPLTSVSATAAPRSGKPGKSLRPAAPDRPQVWGATNEYSVRSLCIVLVAVVAAVFAFVLHRMPGAEGVVGLIVLLTIPLVIWSMVVAIRGLNLCLQYPQCLQFPERYARNKAIAISTLTIGALLSLGPAFFYGVKTTMVWAKAFTRPGHSGGEVLKFNAFYFVFYSPTPPWTQTDAKIFGPGPVLAFAHNDPMYVTVTATPLELGYADARKRVVELAKTNTRNAATSYRLVSESELTRNGVAGWQTETEASIQGRDFYMVHWLLATNGFGYQLVAWGPPSLKAEVKEEANRLFSNFHPTSRN